MCHKSPQLPVRWEKAEIFSKIIAAIFIPIAIFVGGIGVQNYMKERDVSLKRFEIAVGILNGVPSDKNVSLWNWAIRTFNTEIGSDLSSSSIDELNKYGISSSTYADYTTYALRRWKTISVEANSLILKEWLEKNSIKASPMLFMLQDQFAKEREEFLTEVGAW